VGCQVVGREGKGELGEGDRGDQQWGWEVQGGGTREWEEEENLRERTSLDSLATTVRLWRREEELLKSHLPSCLGLSLAIRWPSAARWVNLQTRWSKPHHLLHVHVSTIPNLVLLHVIVKISQVTYTHSVPGRGMGGRVGGEMGGAWGAAGGMRGGLLVLPPLLVVREGEIPDLT